MLAPLSKRGCQMKIKQLDVKGFRFVEGEVERRALLGFLKRWLDPKLSRPVGISPVCFSANLTPRPHTRDVRD